ncbi:3-methyl-2-oxobutanoate hydroxymethyltransferase [Mesoterricola silvestris]|uniref:3-methyl-2-oxobutanoate hydroxymethyltransferase n=1 Tax=Mesoterricola silvestris TaxID=2927979 RepID=A0AA48GRJ3_9BACT|nr:3-methyl-2-oxobutanoate hydroxymethyltransferase [Mesoterricola silvestris]BDU74834.1 3-methyl-2-oxobutanoate hydroxymethyltransferase 2 [Mesoterricola silvestris]
MSHAPVPTRSVTVPDLQRMRDGRERIVMTTAYDAVTARIADASGVDVVLVGDSVGNVCLGFENTLPVTLAMMAHHLEAVARTRPRALLVVDMPYLSFHLGVEDTLRNAGGFIRSGAQGVKLEGGARRVPVIRALVEAEIPVMGHLGLTPQSLNAMGGFKVQGREARAAVELLEDALRIQDAGCFAVVLEGIPAELAERITQELTIPTIGIGAGPGCSGQVLVFHDILGLLPGPSAKFVRTYMNGFEQLTESMVHWAEDVRAGRFPGPQESYMLPEPARDQVRAWKPTR